MNSDTTLTSISVSDALQNILSAFVPLEPVSVPLAESLGLALAENVHSDIDIPPFDNSSMDGYALRASDLAGASADTPARLTVTGYLPAGSAPGPDDFVGDGSAFRIMTGAPVPPGADAVVPFEDTSEGRELRSAALQPGASRAVSVSVGDSVLVYTSVKQGDYIRRAGEDVRSGQLVLGSGISIRPAEIGVLASVGKAQVMVHRRPRVAILATGDELVDVSQMPGPGQIRNSNNYAVEAQVRSWGAEAHNLGVARDDRDHLLEKLREALDLRPDLLVTSAGVSVGDYDFVKEVLMSLGSITMWRVKLKPGKPLAFGHLRGRDGMSVPFLGLPGNPVSSMVTMELFGRPAILKMLGKTRLSRTMVMARLLEPLDNAGGREHYMRGVVTQEGGEYVARTTGKQESNILTSMSRANAFLVVGADTSRVAVGEMVRAMLLDE